MTTLQITLSDEAAARIREQVESGAFDSESAYIETLTLDDICV